MSADRRQKFPTTSSHLRTLMRQKQDTTKPRLKTLLTQTLQPNCFGHSLESPSSIIDTREGKKSPKPHSSHLGRTKRGKPNKTSAIKDTKPFTTSPQNLNTINLKTKKSQFTKIESPPLHLKTLNYTEGQPQR